MEALAAGGVGVAAIVGILVLVGWTRSEVTARGAEQDKRLAAEEQRSKVERERDDERAGRVKAEEERDRALAQSKVHEDAARRAREELTKRVRETLDSGDPDAVNAEVDRLLGDPLPGVRPAGPPSG